MTEAIRTAKPHQPIILITDGQRDPQNPIRHRTVIGLENLDDQSELHRHFKQLIERFNRTSKHHIRAGSGFKATNGALALTALMVTLLRRGSSTAFPLFLLSYR